MQNLFNTLGFYQLRFRHSLLIPKDAHILYRMFIVPGSSRCSVHFSRILKTKNPRVLSLGSLEFVCYLLLTIQAPRTLGTLWCAIITNLSRRPQGHGHK